VPKTLCLRKYKLNTTLDARGIVFKQRIREPMQVLLRQKLEFFVQRK
jgi:hypothetical protein